jgi:uroporphyrin-III C-methyltransferase/precorrin-2 dehydrogenase/sirohydrochlorin ferrochelatase
VKHDRHEAHLRYFPVFFDLTEQCVLIVGAGEVAARKIALLERSGARITVVAPRAVPSILESAAQSRLTLHLREFAPADLEGARLVIVATAQRALNRWIARLCESRAIAVNVVDDRAASRFIVPAVIDRDPVLVAVSSGGASPVLARRLRERLEASIPKRLGELALWLKDLRSGARRRLRTLDERRRFFETLIDGSAARRWLAGDRRGARREAQRLLQHSSTTSRATGEVTLVGAGPGDPELLTLKGLRALADADVIFHDRLVSRSILDLARRDARCVPVGKSPGGVGHAQSEINALLIEAARRGERVVRLKGGDPFIFGRGGEEIAALAQARIPFCVVPGITAASGAAAYSGIPLTHRELAHGVTLVTGHDEAAIDWHGLARPGHTAVFYMGLARLERIAARLIEHGADSARPAALIADATTAGQRVLTAPLARIAAVAAGAALVAPVLLIVGDVVSLHETLAWFGLDEEPALTRSA